jgi:hypothetical protein
MSITKSMSLALVAITALTGTARSQVGLSVAKDTTPKVEMLFVQSAKAATLVNGKLTLIGVGATTVFFSDRPRRIAGHLATQEMISLWSEGPEQLPQGPA